MGEDEDDNHNHNTIHINTTTQYHHHHHHHHRANGNDNFQDLISLCYSSDTTSNTYHHQRRRRRNTNNNVTGKNYIKQNYYIPGLKARKRIWIYERNFTIPNSITEMMMSSSSSSSSLLTTTKNDIFIRDSANNYVHHTKRKEEEYLLIIDGIKMGAMIEINDIFVGNITNQFRRYIFRISDLLALSKPHYREDAGESGRILLPNMIHSQKHQQQHQTNYYQQQHQQPHNTIRISFLPNISTNGRFMAISGGWDWAPYTQNAEESCMSRRVFTFGIVKPLYVAKVSYDNPLILHVIPKIYYLGNKHNQDGQDEEEILDDFRLTVDVHFYLPSTTHGKVLIQQGLLEGEVIFRASFLKVDEIVSIPIQDGYILNDTTWVVSLSQIVRREDIKLWWPREMSDDNDMKSPYLYTLKVKYENTRKETMSKWIEKKIGKFIFHKCKYENTDPRRYCLTNYFNILT